MLSSLRKLKSGYIEGTRVSFGSYEKFYSTTCVTNLSFLGDVESGRPGALVSDVERCVCECQSALGIGKGY